jgi:hypothetical protein
LWDERFIHRPALKGNYDKEENKKEGIRGKKENTSEVVAIVEG